MWCSRQFQILLQRSKTTAHLLRLHPLFLKSGLDHEEYLVSQFILHACSVSIDFARHLFDCLPITPPLFAWNTIIRAYTKSKQPIQSVKLFSRLQRHGVRPDQFTYPFVLKACGQCSMLGQGGVVQSLATKAGLDSDVHVENTLLKMYAACRAVGLARKVFDEMTVRNVVSWSSMIAAYVSCNCPMDGLLVFQQMRLANEKPNSITLVSLLSSCSRLLNIQMGKSIHSHIFVNHIELDVSLGTSLLEMYSSCGHIEAALQVFNSMAERNLQSWTVMVSGLSDHGRGEDAISLFNQMKSVGLKPDGFSFTVILSACSHLGLVDEGQRYFDEMVRVHGVEVTVEHYGCMVDLFGRAGMVEEAYKIIKTMSVEPNSVTFRSFLGACKNHGKKDNIALDKTCT